MAQKNRTDMNAGIDAAINDNTTGEISAADVRSSLKDVSDSAFNLMTDDSDDVAEGTSHLFMTAAERSKLDGLSGVIRPAGSDTQIQYNNADEFGASNKLTFDGTALNTVRQRITKQSGGYTTITGTISSISSSVYDVTISGSGTAFSTQFVVGDVLSHPSFDGGITITRILNATTMYGIGTILSGYSGANFRQLPAVTIEKDVSGKLIKSSSYGNYNNFSGAADVPIHLINGDVLIQNVQVPQHGIYMRSSAADGRMQIGHANSTAYIQFQGSNANIAAERLTIQGSSTWAMPFYLGLTGYSSNQTGLYLDRSGTGTGQTIYLQTRVYATNGAAPNLQVSANGISLGRRDGSAWGEGVDDITLNMGKTSGKWKFGSFGTSDPTEATSWIHSKGTTGYDQLRLETPYTPSSTADSNGNTGDTAWDDNYFYLKTSAGWKQLALSTF